jgi:hypothetical protein
MNHELVNYYQAHPTEDIIVNWGGEEERIGIINRDLRFPPDSGDHIVVPVSLQMKRYVHVPAVELELLENECREEGIKFAGEIRGIVPIREILQNSSEELLMHPIIEDTKKTYTAAIANGIINNNNNSGGGGEDPNTFIEYYKLYDKKPCTYWNCPLHFGNLQVFKHPKSLLLGESINHP